VMQAVAVAGENGASRSAPCCGSRRAGVSSQSFHFIRWDIYMWWAAVRACIPTW
jgi:hypothetical protein